MSTATLERIALLAAAMRAYDRAHAVTTCDVCEATWHVDEGAECRWCAEALEVQREHQRQLLLHPSWLDAGHAGPRYDDLDDVDKAVWDRTRGVTGEGSEIAWAHRLRRAVESGLVTMHEADRALARERKRGTAA